MIIIKFMGGMGNQMFQYALYKKIEMIGKEVKADMNYFTDSDARPFVLNKVFDISIKKASYNEIIRVKKDENLFNKLLKKIGIIKNPCFNEEDVCYHPEIFAMPSAYLNGYWQSDKYFRDINKKIKEIYKFDKVLDDELMEFCKTTSNENSVSIHIRRGDYLSEENQKVFGGICTADYYKKAIEYINKRFRNCKFYVFTNDIMWVREHFKAGNFIYAESKDETNVYKDMVKMSLCKHNIIANSSYSWWGAWLNQNPGKTVIAPEKWMNAKLVKDIWCDDWIRISG